MRKMRLIVVFLFLFLGLIQNIFPKTWTLSNQTLKVDFDDKTALFTVFDKRC
jgi:hypothetical protein